MAASLGMQSSPTGMSDDGSLLNPQRLRCRSPQLRVINNPGRIVSTGRTLAIRDGSRESSCRMDAHTSYADSAGLCGNPGPVPRLTCGWPARTKTSVKFATRSAAAYHSPFLKDDRRLQVPRRNTRVWWMRFAWGGGGGCFFYFFDFCFLFSGCWRKTISNEYVYLMRPLFRNQDIN